jgi:hypothetical protein
LKEIKPPRNIEKWSEIIARMGLDITRPVNQITAKQIKQYSGGLEPRLMAKMDEEEDLPKIFRENNLIILPINRQGYVLVKGKGFHRLESINDSLVVHKTRYPFPVSCSDVTSERVFIDYAFSSGLLTKFAGVPNLNTAFGDKRGTPQFNFTIGGSKIDVDRAQIELDAVYENSDQIIIVEAKIGTPSTFNIKQLFYPFRTFFGRKEKVRNFFFCYDPDKEVYSFWEYHFNDVDRPESIRLVRSKHYRIEVSDMISIKEYRSVRPTIRVDIPQANDINKIVQFPFRISEGCDNAKKMMEALCVVERQSSYYRQAAEILGLTIHDKDHRYMLTPLGEKLLTIQPSDKAAFLCKLLLGFPIMNRIFLQISVDHNKIVTKQEIIDMLQDESHLTGDTLGRRAQTIIAWFRWIRNNLGIVEIERNGNIRFARQMTLT